MSNVVAGVVSVALVASLVREYVVCGGRVPYVVVDDSGGRGVCRKLWQVPSMAGECVVSHGRGVCRESWQVASVAIMSPCQLVNTLRCCAGCVV